MVHRRLKVPFPRARILWGTLSNRELKRVEVRIKRSLDQSAHVVVDMFAVGGRRNGESVSGKALTDVLEPTVLTTHKLASRRKELVERWREGNTSMRLWMGSTYLFRRTTRCR